ncbi:hypothetical protein ACOJUR_08210 [Alicyclobacillus tolerans]|uniref:hypothetical protein n=1 Tax=Alicyclobacillus tolerans TaxID=90970 RepID=UPI003B7C3380
MKLYWTRHAKDRCKERAVAKSTVETAVKNALPLLVGRGEEMIRIGKLEVVVEMRAEQNEVRIITVTCKKDRLQEMRGFTNREGVRQAHMRQRKKYRRGFRNRRAGERSFWVAQAVEARNWQKTKAWKIWEENGEILNLKN